MRTHLQCAATHHLSRRPIFQSGIEFFIEFLRCPCSPPYSFYTFTIKVVVSPTVTLLLNVLLTHHNVYTEPSSRTHLRFSYLPITWTVHSRGSNKWCSRWDLNPHALFRPEILSAVCIPNFSTRAYIQGGIANINFFKLKQIILFILLLPPI